ncbi:hypothetical protein Bca101_101211 [Brassica carinata]
MSRSAAVAAKPRSASRRSDVGADLGGSSKYSNENFEGEEGKPAHPGSGSAEVGSSGWKSTAASRGVGAFRRPLKIRRTECAHAGRTHNASGLQGEQPLVDGTISNPSTVGGLLEPLTWRADRLVSAGADWERLFGSFPGRRTANSELSADKGIRLALNVKVKKFNQARVNGGTKPQPRSGLGRISGKEDPVELDSSPTL